MKGKLWKPHEDLKVEELLKLHKKKWKHISKVLAEHGITRTHVEIRNRVNRRLEAQKKQNAPRPPPDSVAEKRAPKQYKCRVCGLLRAGHICVTEP